MPEWRNKHEDYSPVITPRPISIWRSSFHGHPDSKAPAGHLVRHGKPRLRRPQFVRRQSGIGVHRATPVAGSAVGGYRRSETDEASVRTAFGRKRAREKGVAASFEKVEDIKEIMSYGLMSTPGVMIDGTLVHAGGVRSALGSSNGLPPLGARTPPRRPAAAAGVDPSRSAAAEDRISRRARSCRNCQAYGREARDRRPLSFVPGATVFKTVPYRFTFSCSSSSRWSGSSVPTTIS